MKYFLRQIKKKRLGFFLVTLAIASILPLQVYAQEGSEDSNWTLINETDGVKFYYTKGECDGYPVLFLKIMNGNATQITGNWKLTIEADVQKLIFSDTIMPIEAGAEAQGSCSTLDPGLIILSDLSTVQVNKVLISASIEKE